MRVLLVSGRPSESWKRGWVPTSVGRSSIEVRPEAMFVFVERFDGYQKSKDKADVGFRVERYTSS